MRTIEKPYQSIIHDGCAHAQSVERVAKMDMIIAVGFGLAQVWKGKELIYDEAYSDEGPWHNLLYFEEMAAKDPDYDWRIILHAPLRGSEYQRHGKEKWVLIGSNEGFA